MHLRDIAQRHEQARPPVPAKNDLGAGPRAINFSLYAPAPRSGPWASVPRSLACAAEYFESTPRDNPSCLLFAVGLPRTALIGGSRRRRADLLLHSQPRRAPQPILRTSGAKAC